MFRNLEFKAYCIKFLFNTLGWLASPLFNFRLIRNLEVFTNQSYGTDPKQRLDILKPKIQQSERRPILVFFHGGGWISADKAMYRGIAATLAREGFVTASVNYRLAPKNRFPDQLQDAGLVIDWICRNGQNYGGDTSTIVLAGDSAGAQIASWYASALSKRQLFAEIGFRGPAYNPGIKALLLFYGVYDLHNVLGAPFPFIRLYAQSFLGAEGAVYKSNADIASPIRHVAADLPPVWLCAGERDGLFSQSKEYANALEEKDARCETLFFPRARRAYHGFMFFAWIAPSKEAIADAVRFLKEVAGSRGQIQ